MAKFNHENEYFSMFIDEDLKKSYSFSSNLASGDSLATPCTITIKNPDNVDKSASMIADKTVSSPSVSFTIQNPPSAGVYEIKITCNTSDSKSHVKKAICDVFESTNIITYLAGSNSNSYVTLKETNDYIREVRGHSNSWDTLSIEGRKYLLKQACRDIDKFNYIGEKYYDAQKLEFPRDDHDVITGDVATPITINSFKNTSFTSDTYGNRKSNSDYWKYSTVHFTNTATWLGEMRNIDTSNITTDIVTMTASFTTTPTTNVDFIAFEPLDQKIKDAQCLQCLYILENEGGGTLQNYKSQGAREVEIGDVRVQFSGGKTTMTRDISPKAKQLLSQWIEKHRKLLRG